MRPVWVLALAAAVSSFPGSTMFAQSERQLSSAEQVLLQPEVRVEAEEGSAAEPSSSPESLPIPSLQHGIRGFRQRRRIEDEFHRQWIPHDDVYHAWQWSVTWLTGFIGVNLGPMSDIPFDMLPELVRLNCVWTRPRPNRVLRGSWEGIVELDVMPVVNGPATIVIGGSLLLRYNLFTHKPRRWILYLQSGGGGMYTDEYYFNSPVLSSGFEFIVQGGAGIQLMLGRRWGLNGEWMVYHFSNGGIYLPNTSVNMMGGLVGLTYYFGRR